MSPWRAPFDSRGIMNNLCSFDQNYINKVKTLMLHFYGIINRVISTDKIAQDY